jgi:ribosomal protein L30/L7E
MAPAPTATDRGKPVVVYLNQIRSTIGEQPKTKGAVRALGLHGIGSTAWHFPVPSNWGSVSRCAHLVKFAVAPHGRNPKHDKELAWIDGRCPRGRKIIDSYRSGRTTDVMVVTFDRPRRPSVSVERYELKELGDGARLATPEGDEIRLVVYEAGGIAIRWPTECDPASFFARLLSHFEVEKTYGDKIHIYADNREPEVIPAKGLGEYQKQVDFQVEVARIEEEASGIAFGWQASPVKVGQALGGIVTPTGIPYGLVRVMLEETGAGTIPTHSGELAGQLTKLAG